MIFLIIEKHLWNFVCLVTQITFYYPFLKPSENNEASMYVHVYGIVLFGYLPEIQDYLEKYMFKCPNNTVLALQSWITLYM